MGWFGMSRRSRWGLLALVVVLVVAAAGCVGAQLWVRRYNGPGNGIDQAPKVAVNRDGSRVFVSGTSFGASAPSISTVAYNASDGGSSWTDVYPDAYAEDVAVSPNGAAVFVAGYSPESANGDFVTIGHLAASGHRVWVSDYNGAGNGNDVPTSIAVSPDGTKLFVTGYSTDAASSVGAYATVAYNTANGAQLWVSTFSGTGGIANQAFAVGVSPDSTKVYVTGGLYDQGAFDYGTIAYSAATGSQLWVSRYNGGGEDTAKRLVVSPDGSKVFVTGTANNDYGTVAYNATNGAQLWVNRYNGGTNDSANDLAVSPDGTKLFVTGLIGNGYLFPTSAATVGYNTANGAQRWARIYSGLGSAAAQSIGMKPDGTKVYIAGATGGANPSDYATVAYSATDGAPGWNATYNGPANGYDAATSLAVSADASKVIVTGTSDGVGSSSDFATIAYNLT